MSLDVNADDTGFLSVDADARFGDVLELMDGLAPGRVVIREAPGFSDLDEDDDDVFYVVDSTTLLGLDAPLDTKIGQIVISAGAPPAPVHETVRRHRRGGLMTASLEAAPTVVLSEGVPASVTGGGGPSPPGDSPADGDGDRGSALGVGIDYPKTVEVEATASLLIRLTTDLAGPDVIPVVAAAGDVIDVFVSPRSGFVVEGRPDGQLTVAADGGAEPLPVQVKLRATAIGRGSVTVYAFRDGAALGALTITPEVVAKGAEGAGEGDRASAQGKLADDAPAEADLQFVILEQRDEHDHPELLFLLTGRDPALGLNLKPFGPTTLETGPGGFFTDLYREIEKLPVETEQDKAEATERLHAIGSTLFTELIPKDLQTLLWELRPRIKTVWIQSAEPYVPWEICRLQGTEADGTIVEGEFFCEAFALTRWIPGIGRLPELTLTNVGVIVPGDSGLESAAHERTMLHGLAKGGRTVADIPASYLEVRKALASAEYDAIHFSGHGQFPDQSDPAKAEIELEGRKKLRPSDISGVAANLGRRRPLVFLNACQVGRQAPGLTGIGGWASALLGNGAAAFVGSHWEVTDDLALKFATTFYERLDAGEPIASAARDARVAIRDAGDPTWLAYTVFADPGARLAA